MPELLQFSLLAFPALFVVIDPIGMVPLFVALTPGSSAQRRREMAKRACLVAWTVLVLFSFAGSMLLHAFGITLWAFKAAGGLLLMLTALEQLRAQPRLTRTTPAEEEGAPKDISVVPLAMPLLAGPGSIATAMMLMSRANTFAHGALVIVAITVMLLMTFWLLAASDRILAYIRPTMLLVMERLLGLLLAAIAAQFILDGVREGMGAGALAELGRG